jgi:hypothetical protein
MTSLDGFIARMRLMWEDIQRANIDASAQAMLDAGIDVGEVEDVREDNVQIMNDGWRQIEPALRRELMALQAAGFPEHKGPPRELNVGPLQ